MKNPFKRDPDPFAAAKYSGVFRSVRTRKRKHMRHWWQWAIVGVLTLVLVFGTLVFLKLKHTENKIHEEGPGELPQAEEDRPFNALLVGSDSREGLTEEEQLSLGADEVGGERADTLILAHIDPSTNKVVMVQFPRDLWVPIAGGGESKINSALEGGARKLVRTVELVSGLTINKYVQVNIAGFRDVVDAIGGVKICISEPIPFDPQTGIEVTEEEVGMVKFDGDRAIRFVRSRNFETGDFERIQNQQRFLSAAVDKVVSLGTIFRPTRILDLLDIAGENLSTDQDTTINGLRSLASRFRSFDPESYEAYIVPNLGVGASDDGQSIVLPNEPAMKLLFKAIEQNESPATFDGVPAIDPTTIRVEVLNGSGVDGAADTTAAELADATETGDGGVDVVSVGDAGRRNHTETEIRYDPSTKHMAELVAVAMPGAKLVEEDLPKGVDVQVIVGKKVKIERLIQLLPIPLPKPSAPPPECA